MAPVFSSLGVSFMVLALSPGVQTADGNEFLSPRIQKASTDWRAAVYF
jgi:hypothetical protein